MFEGGVSGVPIPQNRTEIRVNTAQNNIRKPQTALKLPGNFKIPQTAWFCKTAIPQLKIKITAEPQELGGWGGGDGEDESPLVFFFFVNYTGTEGAIENVRINRVSILTGSCYSRQKDT